MLFDFSSEIYAWIRGALLFVATYSLILYFFNRRSQYLYYGLFLFCFFVYFLKNISYGLFESIYEYINYSLLFLGLAAYIAFSRDVLETKKKIPEWDRLLVLAMRFIFIFAFIFITIQILLGYNYQEKLFIFLMPIIAVFTILTYIVFTKIEGKHVTFFIIGSLSYLILAFASYILKQVLEENYFESRGIQPKFLMYVGAIIEIIMTAFLLGNKLKLFGQNKIKAETELVSKTKEMADLKMTV